MSSKGDAKEVSIIDQIAAIVRQCMQSYQGSDKEELVAAAIRACKLIINERQAAGKKVPSIEYFIYELGRCFLMLNSEITGWADYNAAIAMTFLEHCAERRISMAGSEKSFSIKAAILLSSVYSHIQDYARGEIPLNERQALYNMQLAAALGDESSRKFLQIGGQLGKLIVPKNTPAPSLEKLVSPSQAAHFPAPAGSVVDAKSDAASMTIERLEKLLGQPEDSVVVVFRAMHGKGKLPADYTTETVIATLNQLVANSEYLRWFRQHHAAELQGTMKADARAEDILFAQARYSVFHYFDKRKINPAISASPKFMVRAEELYADQLYSDNRQRENRLKPAASSVSAADLPPDESKKSHRVTADIEAFTLNKNIGPRECLISNEALVRQIHDANISDKQREITVYYHDKIDQKLIRQSLLPPKIRPSEANAVVSQRIPFFTVCLLMGGDGRTLDAKRKLIKDPLSEDVRQLLIDNAVVIRVAIVTFPCLGDRVIGCKPSDINCVREEHWKAVKNGIFSGPNKKFPERFLDPKGYYRSVYESTLLELTSSIKHGEKHIVLALGGLGAFIRRLSVHDKALASALMIRALRDAINSVSDNPAFRVYLCIPKGFDNDQEQLQKNYLDLATTQLGELSNVTVNRGDTFRVTGKLSGASFLAGGDVLGGMWMKPEEFVAHEEQGTVCTSLFTQLSDEASLQQKFNQARYVAVKVTSPSEENIATAVEAANKHAEQVVSQLKEAKEAKQGKSIAGGMAAAPAPGRPPLSPIVGAPQRLFSHDDKRAINTAIEGVIKPMLTTCMTSCPTSFSFPKQGLFGSISKDVVIEKISQACVVRLAELQGNTQLLKAEISNAMGKYFEGQPIGKPLEKLASELPAKILAPGAALSFYESCAQVQEKNSISGKAAFRAAQIHAQTTQDKQKVITLLDLAAYHGHPDELAGLRKGETTKKKFSAVELLKEDWQHYLREKQGAQAAPVAAAAVS